MGKTKIVHHAWAETEERKGPKSTMRVARKSFVDTGAPKASWSLQQSIKLTTKNKTLRIKKEEGVGKAKNGKSKQNEARGLTTAGAHSR